MQTRNRNTFTTIHTEGALLPADLLQRISENDASLEGLTPEAYHLAPGERLTEAVNRSWNRLTGLWEGFKSARASLGAGDPGTTITRERWLLPLFQELGYGRLGTARAVEIEGKSYPISHRWQNVPLHLVGCGLDLDKRTPGAAGAARISPHSLLQEYLNRAEDAQWGLVSNGLAMRVLRDNATLTRQAYVEFDLESMFDGEVYSDFVLLWLVCHQSRFETAEKATECLLERWSKSAQERGTRALDDLRRGVEEAIVNLGQGFLQHTQNTELRDRLKRGELIAQDYYRQILRLVYRLIFLFAAEDRGLLLMPDASAEAKKRYQDYYSTTRLRALAERRRGSRHYDRYEALRLVMTLLGSDKGCPELALPALGGFLFGDAATADLNQAKLDNQSLLSAVRSLAFIMQGNTRRSVDYRNLGPEELGSVYESLLELHPLLNTDAGIFQLTSAAGNERKTTGSYYTPTSLIKVLLDSALDPVIENALSVKPDAKTTGSDVSRLSTLESRLLGLKICDPACGSGHFLIAAAHRMAGRLANVRSGGDEPSPNETRRALRDVIRHCIYGVDINPMAVELCKVNLWLESLEPGKPLSFLDAHIKCGNSLVGVGPKMSLDDLEVPDEAFNPVTGDHKATATLLKKRNKTEREGQESLFVTVIETKADLNMWLAEHTRIVEAMPEENAAEVQAKAKAYQKVNESAEYRKQRQIADLWTAAFFWKIEEPKGTTYEVVAPTHGQFCRLRNGGQIQTGLMEQAEEIVKSEVFFHWPLEFAEVAAQGGFDCVLGNPPWEKLQLEEMEFFSEKDENIAKLLGNERKKAIGNLDDTNPELASLFTLTKHSADSQNKFFKTAGRFHYTAVGKMNTYALFAELYRNLMNSDSRAGIIVPTGIATDDTTKDFLKNLLVNGSIVSLYDFENSEAIFLNVHRSFNFCLMTLSGKPVVNSDYIFFAKKISHLSEEQRHFRLTISEIEILNPNTLTLPVFRTKIDAQLTLKIYELSPILVNEEEDFNPWKVTIKQGLFNMTSDSHLFITQRKIEQLGYSSKSNQYHSGGRVYFPLYEPRMINQFDHRLGTYPQYFVAESEQGQCERPKINQMNDPEYSVWPRFWVKKEDVIKKLEPLNPSVLIGFRAVARNTDSRSMIACALPISGIGNNMPILLFDSETTIKLICCLLANLNSIVFDYVVRQKVAISLNFFIVKQLPILPQFRYTQVDISHISKRVLELVYTAYDLQSFAESMGYCGEPFGWDEDRRALLRAELDAYYAALYGLTRDELRYILDPQDVYGPDFPGETFRVLKDKEIRQYGEYRTRRLVLEAWDRLEASGELPEPAHERTTPPAPRRESITLTSQPISPTPAPAREEPSTKLVPQPSAVFEGQPTLSDFGLYKCVACGKHVMGYEKENHKQSVHLGKEVEWTKVR